MADYSHEIKELSDTVIKGGFCIGCGVCSTITNSPFKMNLDDFSKYQPVIDDSSSFKLESSVLEICPFSDKSKNEDELSGEIFGRLGEKHDKLGYFSMAYAGSVIESDFRKNGSSGGLTSWVLKELLEASHIDGVIHVKNDDDKESSVLFKYNISNNVDELIQGAKSKYYPIEMSEVISLIKNENKNYAIVGIPCFIKAIRLLIRKDDVLKNRIKFCIGLVCGHLKSANFANMWSWQNGIHPKEMTSINFRAKLKGKKASNYGVTIKSTDCNGKVNSVDSPPLKHLFGSDWGWGLFKYKACDYCDDVLAETADLTIGDAWLPKYLSDDNGTNIIIVRNEIIQTIINEGLELGKIQLDILEAEEIVKSQEGGFKHRREGLAYRLFLVDLNGKWRPKKRVEASDKNLSNRRKKIQMLRSEISEISHYVFNEALAIDSFEVFVKKMEPYINEYKLLYKISFRQRVINKFKRLF